MSKLYLVVVGEYDHNDGEMYNNIFHSTKSEQDVVDQVNGFFREEASEGHTLSHDEFRTLADLEGFTSTDDFGDREYHISTLKINLP